MSVLLRIGFSKSGHTIGFGLRSLEPRLVLRSRGRACHRQGNFDAAERLINLCRKDGTLPLNICSVDERRIAEGGELVDGDIDSEIESAVLDLENRIDLYNPISFWDGLPYYIEVAVEKVDLKHLFKPVCDEFRIKRTNIGG
jgi:hypothetical protein